MGEINMERWYLNNINKDRFMMDIGKMMNVMVSENLLVVMVMFIKEIGNMIKQMVKEYLQIVMV